MTVKELIRVLKTYDENLTVAIRMYSEQCLFEADQLDVIEGCHPRPDGWI